MKLIYSQTAINRLQELEKYVSNELSNPTAARRIINRILDDCNNLLLFPEMGRQIKTESNRLSEFRMLISHNHAIIYSISGDTIIIAT